MYYTLWELLICAFKTIYVDYADKAFGKVKKNKKTMYCIQEMKKGSVC